MLMNPEISTTAFGLSIGELVQIRRSDGELKGRDEGERERKGERGRRRVRNECGLVCVCV